MNILGYTDSPTVIKQAIDMARRMRQMYPNMPRVGAIGGVRYVLSRAGWSWSALTENDSKNVIEVAAIAEVADKNNFPHETFPLDLYLTRDKLRAMGIYAPGVSDKEMEEITSALAERLHDSEYFNDLFNDLLWAELELRGLDVCKGCGLNPADCECDEEAE